MASFKQGNITFENVNKDGALIAPGFPLVYDLSMNGTDLGGIVNGVDIDWNSAKVLDDTTVRRINTTGDLLYLLHAHLKYNVPYTSVWELITNRFYKVKEDLNLTFDLESEFVKLKSELKAPTINTTINISIYS